MKRLIFLLLVFSLYAYDTYAQEREVEVACDWGSISATLATPDGGGDTVVLLVAGSGPTDRNCNSGLGLNTYSFLMLSKALVEQGVAVMRYDKRGVGLSSVEDVSTLADVVFDDYVDDAARCVEFLQEEGFNRVVVAGHSEGGEIAQHLALREDIKVDALVLLSSPGFPMDTILMRQLSAQLIPNYMGLMTVATQIIQRIKRGEKVAEESVPKELISLFHPSVQPFLHSCMLFDPAELMSRIEQPTLIISGGRDIQVTTDNAEQLMKVAKNGCHIDFPDMTHVLKDSDTSDRIEQLTRVYTNSQLSITDGLSDAIIEFINNNK